ncbi:MAG TPA: fibronectin type III domain-containing protein [Kofleriaceae bacterium]|nr:fibronectin type III domain-containing protein [Kofleriaceae bacterium]
MAGFARVALLAPLTLLAPATAGADGADCRLVEVDFVPADRTGAAMRTPLQIVAWIEDAAGAFVDTVYITRATGSLGLGNRPGRFDFNTGPRWPYGRRTTVFPVWAHRHGLTFSELVFQDGRDSDLSHSVLHSSRDSHYCQPLRREEPSWNIADAGSCATEVYTDKGRFSSGTSLYPPRADLARTSADAADVDLFGERNPFDAVSQATPVMGAPAAFSYPLPPELPPGDYVLLVETSRELDHNATYSEAAYPGPSGISFADFGEPYRGQPSIVYRVPFTVGPAATTATTASYAGYGDPDGKDGAIRPPDATITTSVPGSGAERLALAPGGHRVRVTARPEPDFALPGAPGAPAVLETTSRSARISFIAPGDDDLVGVVRGYDVRIQAGGEITEASFDDATPVLASLRPVLPGEVQILELPDLLFETEYVVAIRAYDDCRNRGPIATIRFTTAERATGEVDACFVATAAYGSAMAGDVALLRGFRDEVLRRSVLGELAVAAYYTFGPAISGAIGESELLRATARGALRPIVDRVGRRRR